MAQNRCDQCRYYVAHDTAAMAPHGHCHHGPPQAWSGDERIGQSPSSIWPIVAPDDWCGQYQPTPGPTSRGTAL